MTGLLLALALAQSAPTEPPGLQITTVTKLSNGSEKIGGIFFIPHPYGPSAAVYYFANPTVCEGMASSAPTGGPGVRVAGPKFGWQVEIISPDGAAPVLKWSRLDGAAKAAAPLNGTKTVPRELPVFKNIELDLLDRNLPGARECGAVSYSLVAHYAPRFRHATAQPKLVEAELWFVHRTPDGKETSQRQAVRMRDGGRGDFYFDDLTVNATVAGRTEPITIEVFGSVTTGWMSESGDTNLTLRLTRRYINPKWTELGIPPSVGRADYPTLIGSGEVVSFVLPPLEGDRGELVGHRFSVRLRIKPLGPGEK